MMSEVKSVRLGDVARMLSGATPFKGNAGYWVGDIPWVSAKDMKLLRLSDAEDHISQEGVDKGSRIAPVGSTLILTRGMTLMNDVPICKVVRPLAFNQDVKALVPSDAIDGDYLLYVLISLKPALLNMVEQAGHGTGKLASELLKALELWLPSLPMQRAIAQVLSALDDKIELNRRMNATLEAMAQAVYKEWFVDGAKEEWEETTVGDEFDIVMGQSPPGDTYNEGGEGVPFFQGRTDFGFRFPTPRVFCSAPTRLAKQGDTLVSVRAPVGSVNMAKHDCAIGRGVAAIRHKTGARSYTYHLMHSLKPQFELFEAGGTVFGSMNKKDFHGIKIQQLPQDRIDAFERLVGAFDDRVSNNETESRTLTALRDTLLPKLMRGEVRVKETRLKITTT